MAASEDPPVMDGEASINPGEASINPSRTTGSIGNWSTTAQAGRSTYTDYDDATLPWSVRKAFRLKCLSLGCLQMLIVTAGVIAVDVFFEKGKANKLWIMFPLGGSFVLGGIFIVILFFMARRHPWNLILSVLITVSATVFWAMSDFVSGLDDQNVVAQMLGMVLGTMLFVLVLMQIKCSPEQECNLVTAAFFGGWLLSLIGDIVMIVVLGTPWNYAIIPAIASLSTVGSVLFICGEKLVKSNPDDFMSVLFILHCMQFLVLVVPMCLLLLKYGSGASSLSGWGAKPKKGTPAYDSHRTPSERERSDPEPQTIGDISV